jgi:hypothetical protein
VPPEGEIVRCVIRRATPKDIDEWPELRAEGNYWLAECPCGEWNRGKTRGDVEFWAGGHAVGAHRAGLPGALRPKRGATRAAAELKIRSAYAATCSMCNWSMFALSQDEAQGAFDTHVDIHPVTPQSQKRARPRKVRAGRGARTSGGRVRIVSGGLPGLGKRR